MYSQLAIDIFTRLAQLVFAHRSEHASERMGAINKPATRQSAQHTLRPPRPTASPPPDHQTHLTPPCAPTCFPRCVRSMPRHPPQPAKRKACSLRSGARNKNHVTDRLHAKARRRFPSNRGPHSGRPDGAICDSRRALTKHMRRLRPEGRHTAGSESTGIKAPGGRPGNAHDHPT